MGFPSGVFGTFGVGYSGRCADSVAGRPISRMAAAPELTRQKIMLDTQLIEFVCQENERDDIHPIGTR